MCKALFKHGTHDWSWLGFTYDNLTALHREFIPLSDTWGFAGQVLSVDPW